LDFTLSLSLSLSLSFGPVVTLDLYLFGSHFQFKSKLTKP
jgi:hypothetical protein